METEDRIFVSKLKTEVTFYCGLTQLAAASQTRIPSKRSAGVAPEVSLKECVTCMPPPSANKATHSGFETQRRRHQKSKTGVSVAPQKGLMSSKIFMKNRQDQKSKTGV